MGRSDNLLESLLQPRVLEPATVQKGTSASWQPSMFLVNPSIPSIPKIE
jgi:hypothetical protein